MSEQDDAIATARAAMDQFAEHLKVIAEAVGNYARELRRQGFMRDEAQELTLEYQSRLFDQMGLGVKRV